MNLVISLISTLRFFLHFRSEYNRKSNLEIIKAAVWDSYGLELDVNDRDDLEWRGRKVSGTAAKLGREVAYHHCTLLVHSDRAFLHRALGADSVKVRNSFFTFFSFNVLASSRRVNFCHTSTCSFSMKTTSHFWPLKCVGVLESLHHVLKPLGIFLCNR